MRAVTPTAQHRVQIEYLRAEQQRLCREFLSAMLDLSYTMATFADSSSAEAERQKCRKLALKAYNRMVQTSASWPSDEAGIENKLKLDRLRAVLAEETPADAKAAVETNGRAVVRTMVLEAKPAPKPEALLTQREREVLCCVAQGYSTKQAAGLLGITFKTAACHRYRIMEKLGVHETASLVRYAIRNGLMQA